MVFSAKAAALINAAKGVAHPSISSLLKRDYAQSTYHTSIGPSRMTVALDGVLSGKVVHSALLVRLLASANDLVVDWFVLDGPHAPIPHNVRVRDGLFYYTDGCGHERHAVPVIGYIGHVVDDTLLSAYSITVRSPRLDTSILTTRAFDLSSMADSARGPVVALSLQDYDKPNFAQLHAVAPEVCTVFSKAPRVAPGKFVPVPYGSNVFITPLRFSLNVGNLDGVLDYQSLAYKGISHSFGSRRVAGVFL